MLESESLCGGHLFLLSRKKDCLFWKISIDSVVWFEYVVGSFAGLVFENRIAVLKWFVRIASNKILGLKYSNYIQYKLESLILAQNERWRRA